MAGNPQITGLHGARNWRFCRSVQPLWVGQRGAEELAMFRIYEWNFSSTAELAVGALLVLTILSVVFV